MIIPKKSKEKAKAYLKICLEANGELNEEKVKALATLLSKEVDSSTVGILTYLHRLVKLELNKSTIKVESAETLDSSMVDEIKSTLEAKYNRKLRIQTSENEKIIGGFKVGIGSDVYDYSTKNRLQLIKSVLSS